MARLDWSQTAQARGSDTLSNGALLNAAEKAGFEFRAKVPLDYLLIITATR